MSDAGQNGQDENTSAETGTMGEETKKEQTKTVTHPIQKIYFGSPGTGKSHKVKEETQDGITINAVFHPEYTYGDFMGKLLPHTQDGKVSYNYYPGHFMRALAAAYKEIVERPASPGQVFLVIDEINRGNSAAIFGTVFQLLDRESNGWSSYAIDISQMEKEALLEEMGYEYKINVGFVKKGTMTEDGDAEMFSGMKYHYKETWLGNKKSESKIMLPSNLNIICTMNTSDESIYYMDSAFKRRWGWEYIPVNNRGGNDGLDDVKIKTKDGVIPWVPFVTNLNRFLCAQHDHIRKVEDKQIGYYFIKAEGEIIPEDQIKNKLMFFLWDSVFARSKKPLEDLVGVKKLITFGDFCNKFDVFIREIASKNKTIDTPT